MRPCVLVGDSQVAQKRSGDFFLVLSDTLRESFASMHPLLLISNKAWRDPSYSFVY
jgi:hypothetical protein